MATGWRAGPLLGFLYSFVTEFIATWLKRLFPSERWSAKRTATTEQCKPGQCLLFENVSTWNPLLAKFRLQLRESRHELRKCMIVSNWDLPTTLAEHPCDVTKLRGFLSQHRCIHAVHVARTYPRKKMSFQLLRNIITRDMPWLEPVSTTGYPFVLQGVTSEDMPNLNTLSLLHVGWGISENEDDEDDDDESSGRESEEDEDGDDEYTIGEDDETPDDEVGTRAHYSR